MSNHSSATVREPHAKPLSESNTIVNALKRRAQACLNDKSIDPQSRAILRYALEINDPWLAELVRRAEAGVAVGDRLNFEETSETNHENASAEKIEALTELICRAGDEPGTKAAALLVLMATVENAEHPKAIADMVKHLAFTHCGELNLFGMIETQIALAEGELFATGHKL